MNDTQTKVETKSEVEMLLDGKKIEVTRRKVPNQSGPDKEIILVRKIPICDMEPLGRAFGKYLQEAMLYAERDEAFIRSLDDESFAAVVETGRQLNFTSFKKWWAWQDQTLEALGQKEEKDALVTRVAAKLMEQQAAAQKAGAKPASGSASNS